MTVAQENPADERIVNVANPGPTPPATSCEAVQPVPQNVPVAVVVEVRYVMWLP
jgi:hypothetical protein